MKEDCKYYNSIYFLYILKLLSGCTYLPKSPGKLLFMQSYLHTTALMVSDMITLYKNNV